MSTDKPTTRVKFGLADSPRELDLEVGDAGALVEEFKQAVAGGESVLWITEEDGRRHGLVVDKIVYVEIEPERSKRGIGFSA